MSHPTVSSPIPQFTSNILQLFPSLILSALHPHLTVLGSHIMAPQPHPTAWCTSLHRVHLPSLVPYSSPGPYPTVPGSSPSLMPRPSRSSPAPSGSYRSPVPSYNSSLAPPHSAVLGYHFTTGSHFITPQHHPTLGTSPQSYNII